MERAESTAGERGQAPLAADGCLRFTPGISLADAQREIILATLAHFTGDKRRTAQALGISLKTLYNRLQRYGDGYVRRHQRRAVA